VSERLQQREATKRLRTTSQVADTARPMARRERRALPSWAIDLIRDGVPSHDLRDRGHRAVWDALGRTALAAVNAGHSRPEWEYEVLRPLSKLGHQNRLGADGKERTAQTANKALNSAWERANKYAAEQPAWNRETARQEGQRRAAALLLVVADPDVSLAAAQRDLLHHAASKAAAQGSVSVNMPRAATAQATGLGEKAVRLHLDRLVRQGFLDLVEHGRARTKTRPGRANVYRIPDEPLLRLAVASLSRETRHIDPEVQSRRTDAEARLGPTSLPRPEQTTAPPVKPGRVQGSKVVPTPGSVRLQLRRSVERLVTQTLAEVLAAVLGREEA
jgi:hypothetical protein